MLEVTADQIRDSLVNATKGEAKRLVLPRLDDVDWPHLDFLGWRDPGSAPTGGMALWRKDATGSDQLVAIALRATPRPLSNKQGMCSLCNTFHSSGDVVMMGAKRSGAKGRDGNTVGASMCADLACSLYARKLRTPRRVQPQETLDIDARVWRLQMNLDRFVARVLEGN